MIRLAALAVVVVVLAGTGAAGAAAIRSGIYGTVTRGPVTPVCSDAVPCDSPAAGVRIVFVRNGRAVAGATTGADGSYRIRLAPGRYRLRVRGYRRWTPVRVLVRRAVMRRVDVSIDTGIR